MKTRSIKVLIGSLLLALGTNALANEKSVFVRESMQATPAWFVNSNEITDSISGLNYKAEMLSGNEVRWTIGNLPPAGSNCRPAHLLGYRGVGVNDVSLSTPYPPRNGSCTAYLDLDNTKVSIVGTGRIEMWSTYINNTGDSVLDTRQIHINELAEMTITNESGVNDTIVDPYMYVDASQVQLIKTFSNTVGMQLDVVNPGNKVRYSKEFTNSSGGGTVVGRLPNAAFCITSGTALVDTTLRVYRIDVFPGQGRTSTLVSTYRGQCQNR